MAYAKAILTIDAKKIKSSSNFKQRLVHNYRTKVMSSANPEYTPSNEYDLIPFHEGVKSYTEAFKKRLRGLDYYKNHKFPENGVMGREIVLSFGSNGIEDAWDEDIWKEKGVLPPDFSLERWKEENIQWLKDTFGEENVVSAVLHMDEKTPHIHAIILPVTERKNRGKMVEKFRDTEMFDYQHLLEYQESYAEKMNTEFELTKRMVSHSPIYQTRDRFYHAINSAVYSELPKPEISDFIEEMKLVEEEGLDLEDVVAHWLTGYYEKANRIFQDKLLQDIKVQQDLEQEIIKLKNMKFEVESERDELIHEFEYFRKVMGNSIKEMQGKTEEIQFTFDNIQQILEWAMNVNTGIKVFPDKEYVKSGVPIIKAFHDCGRSYRLEHGDLKQEQFSV